MSAVKYYGTGRRKKSIARVYLVPGTGNITVNKRDIDSYFGMETLKVIVRQPLEATSTSDKFDVIVSNPPYIPTEALQTLMEEVRDYDPPLALDGSEDGLKFYRIISEKAEEFLNHHGRLFLEIGHDQGKSVPELLRENGFSKIQVLKDLSGNDRMVIAGKE